MIDITKIIETNKAVSYTHLDVYKRQVPWCVWIVMTYLTTRPKWFTSRYNLGDMYKVHRALGLSLIHI